MNQTKLSVHIYWGARRARVHAAAPLPPHRPPPSRAVSSTRVHGVTYL